MGSPQRTRRLENDELKSVAKIVWSRLREQIQSRSLSELHVNQKIFLMPHYLDPVFRSSLRVLKEWRRDCGMDNGYDESLLRRARVYVKAESVEPEEEEIAADPPAKRQNIDSRPNSKMGKAWFFKMRGQAGSSILEGELDKYEAISLRSKF